MAGKKEEKTTKISILDKLRKNTTISESGILADSKLFNEIECVTTDIPMLNVALSGRLDGGLMSGITTIAGASKNFKTAFCLWMARSYAKKFDDAAILFYDNEFGSNEAYFKSFGPDKNKVVHTPLYNLEQLKHDIIKQLCEIERGDHLCIIIDSLGMLASAKEIKTALEGESTADMTRAREIKSLFRMITPHARMKNIPIVIVGHVYDEQSGSRYKKQIVSGGTGLYYGSDTIWIVGRNQEKDGEELVGFNFNIVEEKSRWVREKSKIPITVLFEGGIDKYSGLLDEALESGHVESPTQGWYCKAGSDKKLRAADLDASFWEPILADKSFKDAIESKYRWIPGEVNDQVEHVN